MRNALVTGGSGFIGFRLAKHLHSLGRNITIVDNFSRGAKDEEFDFFRRKNGIKIISADMRSTDFFASLDSCYDEIYHLAAVNGTKNFYEFPELVLEVNILALMNMLKWINKDNCGKFIFSSSSEAYAGTITEYGQYCDYIPTKEDIPLTVNDVFNPRFSYGGSKLIGELLTINFLNAKNVNYSIVRYHNIYGERMGFDHVIPEFCRRIYDKIDPFPIFGGEETRAFCYVLDAVKATAAVMESNNTVKQIIHIGNSGEEVQIKYLAELLLSIAHASPKIDIKGSPSGSVKRRCPDTGKLKTLTGFEAEINLEQGLRLSFDWYMHKFSALDSNKNALGGRHE